MSRKDSSDRHSTKCVLVRFPPELDSRLRAEAAARDLSVAWLVRRLVADGLDRLVPVDSFLMRPDGARESCHPTAETGGATEFIARGQTDE